MPTLCAECSIRAAIIIDARTLQRSWRYGTTAAGNAMQELHQAAIACFLKNLNRKQRVALGLPLPKLRVKIGRFEFSKTYHFISGRDELRAMLVIEAKDKAHLSTLMLMAKGYRVAAAAAGFSRFGIAQYGGGLFCCWDCP